MDVLIRKLPLALGEGGEARDVSHAVQRPPASPMLGRADAVRQRKEQASPPSPGFLFSCGINGLPHLARNDQEYGP